MLSRFPLPLFPLSLIESVALRVTGCCASHVNAHVLGVIVLLAELTLAPVGVSASIPRPLTLFNEEVVGAVRADEQVLGSVVRLDAVPVVDFFSPSQVAPERTFDHQNVLVHVPTVVFPGVLAHAFLGVPTHVRYPARPMRILLTKPANTQSCAPNACAVTTNLIQNGGFRG